MNELVPCDEICNSTNRVIHSVTSSNNNIIDRSLINILSCLCDTNAMLYMFFLQFCGFTGKINVIQNKLLVIKYNKLLVKFVFQIYSSLLIDVLFGAEK